MSCPPGQPSTPAAAWRGAPEEFPPLPLSVRSATAKKPDRKSTRLNSSHGYISYAVFCLKKKKHTTSRQLVRKAISTTRIKRPCSHSRKLFTAGSAHSHSDTKTSRSSSRALFRGLTTHPR